MSNLAVKCRKIDSNEAEVKKIVKYILSEVNETHMSENSTLTPRILINLKHHI